MGPLKKATCQQEDIEIYSPREGVLCWRYKPTARFTLCFKDLTETQARCIEAAWEASK